MMLPLYMVYLISYTLTINYGSCEFFEIKHYDYLLGIPFIDILLGSPPQPQLVVFDTGSSITNLACAPCNDSCNSNLISKIFKPQESSTLSYISCSNEQCGCNFNMECKHSCHIQGEEPLRRLQNALPFTYTRDPGSPLERNLIKYTPYNEWHDQKHIRQTVSGDRSLEEEVDNGTCYGAISYIDGSQTTGPFFSDWISLSDFSNPTPSFNYEMMLCYFSCQNLYNGVLGANRRSTYMDYTLLDHYRIMSDNHNFLGICSSAENLGGTITIGGYNDSYLINRSQINWFPIYDESNYTFRVSEISTFNSKVEGPWQFIYDSGSTRSILPKLLAETMNHEIKNILGQSGNTMQDQGQGRLVIQMSDPSLFFQRIIFYDYRQKPIIEIEPKHLFRSYGNGYWVNNWSYLDGDEILILGSLMTREKYTLLDNESQTIAFAEAKCPTNYIKDRVLEQQFEIKKFTGDLPENSQLIPAYWLVMVVLSIFMILVIALSLIIRGFKDKKISFSFLRRKKHTAIDIF